MFPLTGAPRSERDDAEPDGFAFCTLGVRESGKVNDLTKSLKTEGRTTLLVGHNVKQVFQLAERGYAGCNEREADQ
jgi:hypothetical protein